MQRGAAKLTASWKGTNAIPHLLHNQKAIGQGCLSHVTVTACEPNRAEN